MGLVKRFLRDYGYLAENDVRKTVSELKNQIGRTRAYAAAQMGRLTADWLATATSIDRDIRMGMVPVRSRARDLSQNNEYARAYLRCVKKNVVGSEGFVLQVKAQDWDPTAKKFVPDRAGNGLIESAFRQWARPENASANRRHSFRKIQELVIETVARDGEHFVRIRRGTGINRFAFALQLIEPDFVDHNYNADLKDGNIIRMGVEMNQEREPVAYYIATRDPNTELYGTLSASGRSLARVPASDIIHVFDPERADQTRGISWMAPAMLGLHNLKGYVESAIVNARIGASKMGFLRDPSATEEEYQGESSDAAGNSISEVAPGQIEDIGSREFVPFNPAYPDGQFDPFVKTILRGIGSGIGMAYSSIANDQREATWSSGRIEMGEEREGWKTTQAWFIDTFLNRVYSEWLAMALLQDWLNLPARKFEKFNVPKWTGRRWYYVDPVKEVNANLDAVEGRLKSRTRIAAEDGVDFEELLDEIAEEEALIKEKKITMPQGGKGNGDRPTAGGVEEEPAEPDDQSGSGNGSGRGKDRRSRLLV